MHRPTRLPPDQAEPKEDAAILAKARQWFAEARQQTARDDAEIAAWVNRYTMRTREGGDGGLPGGSFGDGGGCDGGGSGD